MLRDQPQSHYLKPPEDSGFIPRIFLSNYVNEQLSAVNQCDTITIDPHKSGFCPYPAGALCYKDKRMNTFLQITTNVVYYHGDMTLGDIGLEGSKPGAAAAAVRLANRVFKLNYHIRVDIGHYTTTLKAKLKTLLFKEAYDL